MASTSKKVVKRRYPGPAGLLPEGKNLNVDIFRLEENFTPSQINLCSQVDECDFTDKIWLEMKEGIKKVELLEKYNIKWIYESIKSGNLKDYRVPFLAVKIKRMECVGTNPTFILSDPTGDIGGIIADDLYQQFLKLFTTNSILVVKNCSVLSINKTNKHYIVITFTNILKIYSYMNELVPKRNSEATNGIQIVTINEFSLDDFNIGGEKINAGENKDEFEVNLDEFDESFDLSQPKNLNKFDANLDEFEVNLDEFDESFDLSQPKKIKMVNSVKEKEKVEGTSSVIILSKTTQKEFVDVQNALKDIDATNFFDDF